MSPNNRIRVAEGYYELGMRDRARLQLDLLPAEDRRRAQVLGLRVQLHLDAARWDEALALSRMLFDVPSHSKGAYIHAAYCLHELHRTEEARDLLLQGPEDLRDEPVFYYNLACYEAQLGDLETARRWLQCSFQLDSSLACQARKDPDLTRLWRGSGTVRKPGYAE